MGARAWELLMPIVRLLAHLIGSIAFLTLPLAAHALDDDGARLVIAKFLASQKNAQGGTMAGEHVIADLNADRKPDIVLIWHVLGGTSSWPKLTIFLDQGRNYRVLTTDLTGEPRKLTVKGAAITVDSLTLGRNDPRCCPTVKKQFKFRLVGGKLKRQT
jgi:hypothetical protein